MKIKIALDVVSLLAVIRTSSVFTSANNSTEFPAVKLCPAAPRLVQPHEKETRTCFGCSVQQPFGLRVTFTNCRIVPVSFSQTLH